MDDLVLILEVAQTTFDVIIHAVHRTRSAVEKFEWETLVFTKQHEIRRLVDGRMKH